MVDNVSYIQSPTQALVIIHCPHVSTASLSKEGGGGVRGAYRPTCFVANTVSLWFLAWAERDMGTLYISILGL